MLSLAKTKLVVASVLLVCGVSKTVAADLFPREGAPIVYGDKRKEFGTGWYLRGDVSWSRDKKPSLFADGTLGGPSTSNIFGATIGMGYKLNNWLRADLTLDWRAPQRTHRQSPTTFDCPIEVRGLNHAVSGDPIGIYAVNNQCRSDETATLKRGAILANAYLDLGTWAGVTPYVGAGAGFAYGRTHANYNWIDTAANQPYSATLVLPGGFPIIWMDEYGNLTGVAYNFGVQDRSRRIGQTKFNFAWALMAGFSYDVSPNAKIDFGYRYLHMGKWGQASSANTAHDFRVGFRYMID